MMMATTATEPTSLIAFTLPSTPYSAQLARFYIRATLTYHDLDEFAEDAETIASELVTNAVIHADAMKFGIEVMRLAGSGAVALIVTDPSPNPPIKRYPIGDTERGRGLTIIDALSTTWGWRPQHPGKAVYAILSREA